MSFTEHWLQGPQATNFYTRTYTPSADAPQATAVVIYVHGFAEHIGRYAHFHPKLAERGVVVFTFDQRGFGKTALDKEGHKSPDSAYGKTSWTDQAADIAWAIDHVKEKYPALPLFLAGHSMGGGEVLGFATQPTTSPHHAKVFLLSGVIATSPLIHMTKPTSKLMRAIGGFLSKLVPYASFPADVDSSAISHDPKVVEEYNKDPMVIGRGTLRGLDDMLSLGEKLLKVSYSNWPEELPVLFCHGTADQVTSFPASQEFHDKISVKSKRIVPFQDQYHELQNETEDVPDRLVNEIVTFIGEQSASLPKAKM